MNGRILRVRYHNDYGMAEVIVEIAGLPQPLIFFDEDDNDQTIHIFEYWSTMWEQGDLFLETMDEAR